MVELVTFSRKSPTRLSWSSLSLANRSDLEFLLAPDVLPTATSELITPVA